MTRLTKILFGFLIALFVLNGVFIYRDIQMAIKENKVAAELASKNAARLLIKIEQKLNLLQERLEIGKLSAIGREKAIEDRLKNLPNKIKTDRFILEQKLKLINARINNETIGALGSGVAIKYKGKFYILSAGHLATVILKGEQDDLSLWEYNRKICDLEIVKHKYNTHEETDATMGEDLILLRPKDRDIIPRYYVDIDSTEPITGSEVYIVGNPMGIEDVVSMGRVIQYKNNFMYITDNIYFGNSGGGVYTIEGKLVGIVSHMHPMQPDKGVPPYMIYGIVRMNTIREFMRGVD